MLAQHHHGVRFMAYEIEATFAGETSRVCDPATDCAIFNDIVAAALRAQECVDVGYDVVIIRDSADGRVIVYQTLSFAMVPMDN
jgi:hypothetical protein